jgi:predicted ATPase
MKIDKITIENFLSIRLLKEFQLEDINILIGGNGVGKTNFISFLKLLKNISNEQLRNYTAQQSGANNILYKGQKKHDKLIGRVEFKGNNNNVYGFTLKKNNTNFLFFDTEYAGYKYNGNWQYHFSLKEGSQESDINGIIEEYKKKRAYEGVPGYVKKALSGFTIYHFHDTSLNSPIKQSSQINDNKYLRFDGSNIASFLYRLEKTNPFVFKQITATIRLIAPFFDKFEIEELPFEDNYVQLDWKERDSDQYFGPHQLSDGTIRMIALITLLLQPTPPDTIIIDEPELGLHPAAISLLATLIKDASKKCQIIISTQSVTLINHFQPKDLIIVDRDDSQTVLKRLKDEDCEKWIEEYSLGDVWEKNIIGGRP